MSNPLVVTGDTLPKDPNETPDGIKGIGIAESIHDVTSLNDGSSWVEAGLAYGGLAMEAVSIAVDPVGTLLSYGLSWLIEHVEPLKEALDWFAGDPDGVKAYGATWANVSKAVGEAVQQYDAAVKADTAQWTGAAGDAYRRHAAEKSEALSGAAELANTISTVVTIMGEV
ncbi:WXG100 family type VII secretion target, partial [Saccharopolyspora thermophila]